MAGSTIQKRLDDDYKSNDKSKVEIQKGQGVSKFTITAEELGKIFDDYIHFTFSSEEFKKALKEKFGGNINQFNQNLVLYALTLAYMEKKVAEGDEELKKLLPSLQEKRDAINKNIEKIAKDLGYTVSQYSLDKLMGKDLKGVKETLAKDFGVEPKLEALFSPEALNSITDLFAFIVSKFYPSSVNAPVATVPIISDKNDKTEDNDKQKSTEEKQRQQQIFNQPTPGEKQNKEYHSPLRGTGKKIAIAGVVLGVLGGVLVAGGFAYLPMAAFGLLGVGLIGLGFPLVFAGGVTWMAGLISEARHNHHVQKAQDEVLKQEEKKKKEQKKHKKEEELKLLREFNNAKKDEKALKKQLTDQAWLEKFINQEWLEKYINAKTDAERKKRVEEAKKEIEKIMEEAKKLHISTALHDLLIEKAKDPNTPSWFLALLAQLRLSNYHTDIDILKALAGNPNTPSELLVDFAKRKRYFWARGVADVNDIREIAAKNQSTTPWVLEELLLKDKDNKIKAAAAANPSTPPDALSKAIFNKNFDISIKRIIAGNPSAPQKAIEYALKSKDENVALAALENPSILKYSDLLELASRNQENPRIKEEALKKLKELGLKS